MIFIKNFSDTLCTFKASILCVPLVCASQDAIYMVFHLSLDCT